MREELLKRVLSHTGYIVSDNPAPGLFLHDDARSLRRSRGFQPDAVWRASLSSAESRNIPGAPGLKVYFKVSDRQPDPTEVSEWRREIWNEGFAPLLWIISPERIDIYNAFARPTSANDSETTLLRWFGALDEELRKLDEFAGRLVMETGQFWTTTPEVDRKQSVDQQLLTDLDHLQRRLCEHLDVDVAQGLIGRTIFTQYLVDREVLPDDRLQDVCGSTTLIDALRRPDQTAKLFDWLREIFNGDMFPPSIPDVHEVGEKPLHALADFLSATNPNGQLSLFPYQFDIIPVELISYIYEQFAHSAQRDNSNLLLDHDPKLSGVHYTPVSVVTLILDEVMEGLNGQETVLDLTCGSGIFLVEAFRRLVHTRSDSGTVRRETIREVLYDQIYGIDKSDAAVRVAAFSLYLAALELDPDPQPLEALKFEPLIGKNLFIGDARDIEKTSHGAPIKDSVFDLVVGNPPWTFRGKKGTAIRRDKITGHKLQSRGEGQDFIWRALEFSHEKTRFGVVLAATQFFSRKPDTALATQTVLKALSPVTIIDFSDHNIFHKTGMPAVVLLAKHRSGRDDEITVVHVPWSNAAERVHDFEISPSDVRTLSLSELSERAELLKVAALGTTRDRLLLDHLMQTHPGTVREFLIDQRAPLKDGLIYGKEENRAQDATELIGLPVVGTGDLKPFHVPDDLEIFSDDKAQRSRKREIYKSPLLLIKEFVVGMPRPLVAVVPANSDTVYTDAFFGASFSKESELLARALSICLSSSLAGWFFYITGSEFGIYKRRLHMQDVLEMPIPDLSNALNQKTAKKLCALEASLVEQSGELSNSDWAKLDQFVFDLYGLDEQDRLVIRDGYKRAEGQWKSAKRAMVEPAECKTDVKSYADSFLMAIAPWFEATSERHMTAQVFDLPHQSPLRVVRFLLSSNSDTPSVSLISPSSDLQGILVSIGDRLGVKISNGLIGKRELRVHGENEVIIIKPAAKRHWQNVVAMSDADAVISESFTGQAL